MLGRIKDFDRFCFFLSWASVSASSPSAASPMNFLFIWVAGEGCWDKKGEELISRLLLEPNVIGVTTVPLVAVGPMCWWDVLG